MVRKQGGNRENGTKEVLLVELASRGEVAVGSLIEVVSRNTNTPKSTVARALYGIKLQGRARIGRPIGNMSRLQTFYSVRNAEFWVLSLFPLVSGLTVLEASVAPLLYYLRVIFGAVSVLFLPGYGVVGTLYLKRELSSLQIFTYSIAVSLAIVPLVGVALNYTPWGISLDTVMISFLMLDEVLLLTSSLRRISGLGLTRTSNLQKHRN